MYLYQIHRNVWNVFEIRAVCGICVLYMRPDNIRKRLRHIFKKYVTPCETLIKLMHIIGRYAATASNVGVREVWNQWHIYYRLCKSKHICKWRLMLLRMFGAVSGLLEATSSCIRCLDTNDIQSVNAWSKTAPEREIRRIQIRWSWYPFNGSPSTHPSLCEMFIQRVTGRKCTIPHKLFRKSAKLVKYRH